MSLLPYFRWYPADATGDEKYASMNDQELGFFHRCLNYSWINFGLPSDLKDLASLMRVSDEYMAMVWPKVSKSWHERDGRLHNNRQEQERDYAIAISERNKRPGNANASRENRDRVLVANRSAHNARYECVSESGFAFKEKTSLRKSTAEAKALVRAAEFAAEYPDQSDQNGTVREYLSLVTPPEEDLVFACLERYKASEQVARGVMQAGWRWLRNQKENGWSGKWATPKLTWEQERAARWREEEQKAREEDEKEARDAS